MTFAIASAVLYASACIAVTRVRLHDSARCGHSGRLINTHGTGTMSIYQTTTMPTPGGIMQSDASNCNTGRRVQNGGCNSKSHLKGGSKSAQERRYTF